MLHGISSRGRKSRKTVPFESIVSFLLRFVAHILNFEHGDLDALRTTQTSGVADLHPCMLMFGCFCDSSSRRHHFTPESTVSNVRFFFLNNWNENIVGVGLWLRHPNSG